MTLSPFAEAASAHPDRTKIARLRCALVSRSQESEHTPMRIRRIRNVAAHVGGARRWERGRIIQVGRWEFMFSFAWWKKLR